MTCAIVIKTFIESGGTYHEKMTLFLTALILSATLTGCGSLFSSGDAPKQAETEAETEKNTDIQISDTYVHHDPEGLEYAKRYAYTSGKNVQDLVDSFKQDYDLDFTENYMIIYADAEDKPLAQYDYYVMADSENAEKCCGILGGDFTTEGNVALSAADADTTQMMIDMNVQYGSLKEKTVSAYALFMKDVNGFMDVE